MPSKVKRNQSSTTSTTKTNDTGGSSNAISSDASGKQKLPDWPQLQPLVPVCDLQLETLLADQIVLIPSLFTAKLARSYVTFLASLPLLTTPDRPKRGEAARVNDRFEVQDARFAERLYTETGLRDLITQAKDSVDWGGTVCGLNPRIRVYRYRKGQFFDKHYDDYNLVQLPGPPPKSAKTTWTLLLYLTGSTTGCEEGETVFYPEAGPRGATPDPISVTPAVGLALLHKHGADCLLHEGRAVTAGEKWIIRSDLCVQR